MATSIDPKVLGRHLRSAREAAGVTQIQAQEAIDVSQPTYSRIEAGTRTLKGDELILLADRFGLRVAAITGLEGVQRRSRFVARTDIPAASMEVMRDRLASYLELDSYLAAHGI